jgi:long-chain acyl-CoA synthetase
MAVMGDNFETVVHMLERAMAEAGAREALVCEGERLTYEEYGRCVAGFAAELEAMGVAGQRVVLLMGNSIDFCIALFAVHAAGGQAAALNPLYTESELRPIVTDAAPAVILHDAQITPMAEALGRAAGVRHVIALGPAARRLTVWRDEAGLRLPPLPSGTDLANIQYTGGTTGRAKGAMLTHRAIAVNIGQRDALAPMRKRTERLLCVVPLFHVYAMSMCLHSTVYCQGTLVIMRRFQAEPVLAALSEEKITIFSGSPTLFTGLLGHEGFAKVDFSHLRMNTSGGSALPAELLRRFEDVTGAPVVEGYGQSEAGPVISFNPLDGIRKPMGVGLPVPGGEVQIVDLETGTRVLGPGEKGEIRVRGPQIMCGYRNLPEETAATLRGGWLYTGDIGEFDEDGYLFIRDRKKEMVIVSGFNVFPREVEEVLYHHPAVREAAVIGVPDDYKGEALKAFVSLRPDTSVDEEALRAHCRAKLAGYKVPSFFEIVEDIPKTGVGKIDKKQLRGEA